MCKTSNFTVDLKEPPAYLRHHLAKVMVQYRLATVSLLESFILNRILNNLISILLCAFQWTEISATKDYEERGNLCNTLFSDESKEHKLYEAIKFIMLYEVVEAYEQIKNREEPIHNLFSLLLARDSSSDPLSFMMNHLNAIGDSICLDQVMI